MSRRDDKVNDEAAGETGGTSASVLRQASFALSTKQDTKVIMCGDVMGYIKNVIKGISTRYV